MDFTIKDRLFFYQRVGEGEGFINTIIKKSIMDKLSLTIEEISEYNVRDSDNGVEWNDTTYTRDILFLEPELKILQQIVEVMDENGEIDFSNIDICSQIMG